MPNLEFYFNQEEMDELKELRIDSIREGDEMTAQQIVKSLIHEKFVLKHGAKTAPLIEENDADDERCENITNNSECWTVKDAMSYINEQTKRNNSNSIIYNAVKNREIEFFYIGKRHYFNPQDVKKWLNHHRNHKVYKTDKAPPIQKKELKKRVYTEEQLEKMRERATHARMFIGKPKQETTQCVTN